MEHKNWKEIIDSAREAWESMRSEEYRDGETVLFVSEEDYVEAVNQVGGTSYGRTTIINKTQLQEYTLAQEQQDYKDWLKGK